MATCCIATKIFPVVFLPINYKLQEELYPTVDGVVLTVTMVLPLVQEDASWVTCSKNAATLPGSKPEAAPDEQFCAKRGWCSTFSRRILIEEGGNEL